MPPNFSPISRPLLVVCLLIISLAIGWRLGGQAERVHLAVEHERIAELFRQSDDAVTDDPEKSVSLDLLWSVWRLLQDHYIDPGDLKRGPMVYGAVRGMVSAIGDPYTSFLTPEEHAEFQEGLDGHLQGIGAELSTRDGLIVIVSPIKKSPAERAGLLPGDIITEVDDWPTYGKTLAEVVKRIRGKRGTTVTLTIERDGEREPVSVTITRADITVPSVELRYQKDKQGVIAIAEVNQFGSDTTAELTSALRDVLRHGNISGLVLDLRYNGGGYLTGAVEMSSLFLTKGKVVTVERREGEPQRHYVDGRPLLPDLPMVILINEGTASAAEIVAGALRDAERATIVGTKSFGKGTVQEVIELPGGSSLRVTTAHWLTPSGRNLAKEGITPDVVVERTKEDREANRDPQLDAAIAHLLKGR
ncbi:MAG: Carboxyl-terminal protease [Candidatus Peregrinibacteria bacterium Gr01-1014_25]|nr:MAG: Carboxyl-terminal protease [Candidatus Peregrinibacteria bacterium Gr01-1014_25]